MNNTVILNIAIGSYLDPESIRSQNRSRPDARVLPDLHIPDHVSRLTHKRRLNNLRLLLTQFSNHNKDSLQSYSQFPSMLFAPCRESQKGSCIPTFPVLLVNFGSGGLFH